jgi:outer membrane protein assembly factor BamB
LGDVAQEMSIIHGKLFVAVNNSNKLMVLNPSTFSLIQEIKDIQFPRHMVILNDSLMAVSSLYTSHVYIINHRTFLLKKIIEVDLPNTENMLVYDGILYVTNWNEQSHFLYKISTTDLTLVGKINLTGASSHDIVGDKQKNIWVLSGNKYKQVPAYLERINTSTGERKVFTFEPNQEPLRLTLNPVGDELFFIKINYDGSASNNGLYHMNMADSTLPTQPLISANSGSYFYAFGIDPITNHILLSDPKGFNQHSTVYEYSINGHLLNEYQTGIGSNQFLFP